MQVVGGPNSTGEGMNKINTGGKSRENCASQFWPAKLYQKETLAIHRDRGTNGNEIGENITIIKGKSTSSVVFEIRLYNAIVLSNFNEFIESITFGLRWRGKI